MSTPTLLLPPDEANYVAPFGHTAIRVILNGGAGRYRADQLGATFLLAVQWTCDSINYNYLTAFYRTATDYGSLPFLISLILDSNAVLQYTAYFVPDTFQLASQSGQEYVVAATLEVIPNASYASGDAAIITAGPDTI